MAFSFFRRDKKPQPSTIQSPSVHSSNGFHVEIQPMTLDILIDGLNAFGISPNQLTHEKKGAEFNYRSGKLILYDFFPHYENPPASVTVAVSDFARQIGQRIHRSADGQLRQIADLFSQGPVQLPYSPTGYVVIEHPLKNIVDDKPGVKNLAYFVLHKH